MPHHILASFPSEKPVKEHPFKVNRLELSSQKGQSSLWLKLRTRLHATNSTQRWSCQVPRICHRVSGFPHNVPFQSTRCLAQRRQRKVSEHSPVQVEWNIPLHLLTLAHTCSVLSFASSACKLQAFKRQSSVISTPPECQVRNSRYPAQRQGIDIPGIHQTKLCGVVMGVCASNRWPFS